MYKILTIIVLCSLSSCFSGSLKEYYFPLNIEDEIAVYEYVNVENPKYSEFWRVITDPSAESIVTESYRAGFQLYNTMYETYESHGAELVSYIDYEEDKEGNKKEIKGTLKSSDVFRWDNKKVYDFSLDYVNKYGRFSFLKRRTNLGFETVTIKEEEYQSIKFKDEYFVHAIDQEDRYSFYQICYYAKGVGMVKYERYIPNADVLILELDGILTDSEFKKRKVEAEKLQKK